MSSPSSSEPSSSSHLNSLQITKEGIQTTSSHTRSDSNSDEDAAALIDTSNQEARQNQTVGSDSEAEDPTSGKRKRKRIHFNVEQLQTVYHLPLKTVSAAENSRELKETTIQAAVL
ncbi:hypothetical protein P3T76_010670 [Phytophthora citrophthora]|uniref:Uncharacterized protein n=1 Tax=Phytophthora citrophthora TaxID=4793 RepID=A0AAD9GBS8_9STRA|nr:hypothetical protein P3T76_010670 [Phytophthora citrophthora]